MHRKSFKLTKPLDDLIFPLEQLLSEIARTGLVSYTGTYTGTGKEQSVLTTIAPKFILIMEQIDTSTKETVIAGDIAISIIGGITYIPGIGYKKNCVISIANNSFTLGTDSCVNTPNNQYQFFVIG